MPHGNTARRPREKVLDSIISPSLEGREYVSTFCTDVPSIMTKPSDMEGFVRETASYMDTAAITSPAG
jgi:hypothetical protein